MANSPPFVFFYTTAGGAKLPYRRGILDALCYPTEHVIRYHYRISELSPEVTNLAGRTNVPALIVFVDSLKKASSEESGARAWEINYFPLRLCEISRIPSIAQRPSHARVEFSLKLGQFVRYKSAGTKEQWHSRIAQFDSQRLISATDKPSYFAVIGSDLFTTTESVDVGDDWETMIRFVSQSEQMKNAVFMKLSRPQLRQTRMRRLREFLEIPAPSIVTKDVPPYTEGSLTTYTVRPAREYRIDITIYDSPYTTTGLGQHSGLEIKSSSDQVYLAQPFHSIVSGLLERSAILSFKRTTEPLLTTLAFTVTDTKDNTTTNNPVLHLYITPYILITLLFLVLVFFGSLSVSLDIEAFKTFASEDLAHFLYAVTKISGSFMLVWAAYIAYKILPKTTARS